MSPPWADACRPALRRFMEKVQPSGTVPPHAPELGECWLWTGATSRGGQQSTKGRKATLLYGSFHCGGQGRRAHIWVCVLEGRWKPGHHVDHLCRNQLCVRSSHLEVVPPEVNLARRWEHGFRKEAA